MPTASNQRERHCEVCSQPASKVPFGRIEYDPVKKRCICNECWVKVDPAKLGYGCSPDDFM